MRGFTLIEVGAIVAILARIALLRYESYVRRGQAQEAFSALADYRTKLELGSSDLGDMRLQTVHTFKNTLSNDRWDHCEQTPAW